MENLWKKGNYVDIFESQIYIEGFEEYHKYARTRRRAKDNKVSTTMRLTGDELYRCKLYTDAIYKYTSSLRFAENGSSNVGMAYYKRARCHFRERNYYLALVDIDLAKEAFPPSELPPDLPDFREKCYLMRNVNKPNPIIQFDLDFEPSKIFPCLANVVDLKYNEDLGRHFVANCDIENFKTILKEDVFAVTHLYNEYTCYTCRSKVQNFIPCENCTIAIYCNPVCKAKKKTHSLECGSIFPFYGLAGSHIVQKAYFTAKFDIETLMNAIVTFGDVEKLMKFVKTTLMEDPDQIPKSIQSDEDKYRVYLNLKKFENEFCVKKARYAFALAMQIPSIRELFDTLEKERFLMHLVTHHVIVNSTNGFEGAGTSYINLIISYFNHSCEPNADTFYYGFVTCGGVTRNIKQDEDICISYLSKEKLKLSTKSRQNALQQTWGFLCECSKCEKTSLCSSFCSK